MSFTFYWALMQVHNNQVIAQEMDRRCVGPTPDLTLKEDDPAFLLPGVKKLAQLHPQDWEERLHPHIQLLARWQRLIGNHGLVTGLSQLGVENADLGAFVAGWDGTDLYELGLPRTYNGQTVVVVFEKTIPATC